jgi:hypothetical protein
MDDGVMSGSEMAVRKLLVQLPKERVSLDSIASESKLEGSHGGT